MVDVVETRNDFQYSLQDLLQKAANRTYLEPKIFKDLL